MALEVVGGAFLSASLHALFVDIHFIVDFVRRNKVDEDLLNKLENKLSLASGVLDDAERQQITNPNVRNWLEQLKDAIHNAEDLVDEIKTEALRCQVEADCQLGFRRNVKWVRNFFPSRFWKNNIQGRIVKIIESVDDIVKDIDRLGLIKGVQTSIPLQIQRSSLNILAKESDVYGRDAEKKAIIEFLLSDDGHKISVMPIVGMGGLGKTTLAQLVFNMIDEKAVVMEKPFVIKEWITVSDESKSDVFTLTKAIYEKVTKSTNCSVKETFQLQLKMKEASQGKKFLFVLDDVWNVDFRTWKDLQIPFESAANGSKIIVTTRLQKIAKDLGTAGSEALYLTLLSEDDGWKLFSKYAFDDVEPSLYPHLEEIGKKIVEKCSGNPLAVKSLGCLLHSQPNPKEWENVLVNDIWELDQGEGGILPALWLSYYYLPRHLKRCFAYCSIFPKDYEFSKENLIWLWMAENLLQPQNNMMLEEVGEKYFEDLTSRSFFLVDQYGRRFTMHDLVTDLAKFVSGESCLSLDDNCSRKLTRKTRHISCIAFDMTSDMSNKLEDLLENKVLRTLLLLGDEPDINPKDLRSMQYLRVLSASTILFTFEGATKLFKFIGSLKLLRYLDLSYSERVKEIPDTICKLYNLQTLLLRSCYNLAKLSDSIGNLKNLRYLDLSYCYSIEKMPDTICKLYNLQTLLLRGCPYLAKLSNSIGNLKHLRCLDLSYCTSIEKIPDTICCLQELRTLSLEYCTNLTQLPTNISMLTNLRKLDTEGTSLKEMPPKISNLKNLQNLPEFVVGKSSGIEELGNLTNLHGGLRIRRLENVEEAEDVSKCILKNKKHITDLRLEWSYDSSDVSHNKPREALDRLQPHTNLADLSIGHYGGRRFPDWVGHHSFSCIKKLILSECKNCDRLPSLGELPSLEKLWIRGFDKVERIGDELYLNDSASSSPPFKSLKKLRFDNMREWKEWSLVGGAFPNLKQLYLWNCPKLKGECLPDIYLPSLEELQILDIIDNHHVVASLSRCQFPSLRSLRIGNCGGMKSFPQGRLPSTIQSIQIWGCEDLVSLSEEGWPCSNLKSLHIGGCQKLFAHSSNKWNLGMLTSLTSLKIDHLDMEGADSFPEEEGQLPTTLTSLHLVGLGNIKSLNGTALRHLQSLSIHHCKQLQCLPEEGLPASLSELDITGCPLLKPRCQRGIGLDWDNIQHIPNIWIDYQRI